MWVELLQEIRVAQTGVQILFGFLLTVVFTPRYADLQDADKVIYIVTVVLGRLCDRRPHRTRVPAPPGLRPAGEAADGAGGVQADLRRPDPAAGHHDLLAAADPARGHPRRLRALARRGCGLWYRLCWFALPLWTRRRYTTN